MATPKFFIGPNTYDKANETSGTKKNKKGKRRHGQGIHHTSPDWVVFFVRFKEATSSRVDDTNFLQERPAIIVHNDCVAVDVDRPKNSFAKTASLTMKIGDTYYLDAVASGDWAFVWMGNSNTDMQKIFNYLRGFKSGTKAINDWDSGFKFMGRVTSVAEADVTQVAGVRTITQNVTCQAFTEMASSVYFTTFAKQQIAQISGQKTINKDANPDASGAAGQAQVEDFSLKDPFLEILLETALGKQDNDKFREFFEHTGAFGRSPDTIIAFIFIALMGIQSKNFDLLDQKQYNSSAIFGEGIQVPPRILNILGRTTGGKRPHLWKAYNILLGVQKYTRATNPNSAWKSFNPRVTAEDTLSFAQTNTNIFYRSKALCKGFVTFVPSLWENRSLWDFMLDNLNPVVNEMYTALKVDATNKIVPTLIIREKPFSTGLYDRLSSSRETSKSREVIITTEKPEETDSDTNTKTPAKVEGPIRLDSKAPVRQFEEDARTFYHTLPRWVISPKLVLSYRARTDESKRVNFVQVNGTNLNGYVINPEDAESILEAQFATGNYVIDREDIKRHGFRPDIQETKQDHLDGPNFTTVQWAKMRGDWLFNGHLKLNAVLILKGVQEPICEGDNCEIYGIVYHIIKVKHSASVNPKGLKVFNTMLTLSNGILAKGLNSTGHPNYPATTRSSLSKFQPKTTGVTDIQKTRHRNRDPVTGEEK